MNVDPGREMRERRPPRYPAPGAQTRFYVLLDIFSRYVVGWMVGSGERRARRDDRTCLEPQVLTLHSDRGAPMTSVSGCAQQLTIALV